MGDCGARGGATDGATVASRGFRSPPADDGANGNTDTDRGFNAGWAPYTIDPASFAGDGAMQTTDFDISTIFNGGFCANIESSNCGDEACDDFAVEVAMDPAIWSLQKHTSALRQISKKDDIGAHHRLPSHGTDLS